MHLKVVPLEERVPPSQFDCLVMLPKFLAPCDVAAYETYSDYQQENQSSASKHRRVFLCPAVELTVILENNLHANNPRAGRWRTVLHDPPCS